MTYRTSFLSAWNSIKKIPSLLSESSDEYLKNTTVLPWLLELIKKFLAAYKKNKRNSWEYQFSCFQFQNLQSDADKKRYLIKQFNESLVFYSKDKENPWVIDEGNLYFIKIKKKYAPDNMTKELSETSLIKPSVYYAKTTESTKIHLLPPSLWERANHFTDKNKVLQFFGIIWNTVSSHANLLYWISFLLIMFSLSFHSFPLIVLCITGLAAGYFIVQCIFSFKKKSTAIAPLLSAQEEERLIQCIKQEFFNQETYKREFSVIQDQLASSTIELTKLVEQLASLKKTETIQVLQKPQLEASSIYQHLNQVYPKTQFIFSLFINFTSVALYGYLVSWAASTFLSVIGVAALASLLASPAGIAILIVVPIVFFLVRHIIQFRSREDHYQKTIHSLLTAPCACPYSFTDANGQTHKIETKWEKFEYLREKIHFLEKKIEKSLIEKKITPDSPLYLLFEDHIKGKSDIYKLNDPDKTQSKKNSFFTKIPLTRLTSFFAGGFYGFGLGRQIAVESNLGIRVFLKISLLPAIVVLLPLFVINAIANLITYHLDAKQRDRMLFIEQLDCKLQSLEYMKKKLHYLGASLEALETPSMNENTNRKWTITPERQSKITKTQSSSPLLQTKFFSHATTQLPDAKLLKNRRSNSFSGLTR